MLKRTLLHKSIGVCLIALPVITLGIIVYITYHLSRNFQQLQKPDPHILERQLKSELIRSNVVPIAQQMLLAALLTNQPATNQVLEMGLPELPIELQNFDPSSKIYATVHIHTNTLDSTIQLTFLKENYVIANALIQHPARTNRPLYPGHIRVSTYQR